MAAHEDDVIWTELSQVVSGSRRESSVEMTTMGSEGRDDKACRTCCTWVERLHQLVVDAVKSL